MPGRYIRNCGSLSLRPYLSEDATCVHSNLTGDIRHLVVDSKYLGQREIVVYLPPGYSETDSWLYPFALLQDGQNIFDSESAVFGVEWGVDETAERLIAEQKIAPVILVAVYNSPDRITEYTPFPDPEHGGGGADLYRVFLVEELIPFLAHHFSISRRPEDRAVIGSSLGGLLALFLGWTADFTFGKIAALSPSLWWGRRSFLTGMGGGATPQRRPLIWLDAGTDEVGSDMNHNGVPDLIDDLRTLRAILLAHGYVLGDDLAYREIQGGTHDESSWSRRVADILTFFFPQEHRLRY